MGTFDLHYHANIHGLPPKVRQRRLERHVRGFASSGAGCVASTEHSYKDPLGAYLALAEACDRKLPNVAILPGVEFVTREKIDIILLLPSEEALRRCLREYSSFSWSVRDVRRVARDVDALSIVPHPFFIGRSCAGSILSGLGYANLLKRVDYVEIHNGGAWPLRRTMKRPWVKSWFPKTSRRVESTWELPNSLRGRGLGWAVGSDAHFPGLQRTLGTLEDPDSLPGEEIDPFTLLRGRVRFTPVDVGREVRNPARRLLDHARHGCCACDEALQKLAERRRSGLPVR